MDWMFRQIAVPKRFRRERKSRIKRHGVHRGDASRVPYETGFRGEEIGSCFCVRIHFVISRVLFPFASARTNAIRRQFLFDILARTATRTLPAADQNRAQERATAATSTFFLFAGVLPSYPLRFGRVRAVTRETEDKGTSPREESITSRRHRTRDGGRGSSTEGMCVVITTHTLPQSRELPANSRRTSARRHSRTFSGLLVEPT